MTMSRWIGKRTMHEEFQPLRMHQDVREREERERVVNGYHSDFLEPVIHSYGTWLLPVSFSYAPSF